MRRALTFLTSILLFSAGCSTTHVAAPAAPSAPAAQESHGLRLDDEAAVLRLEDRREFDPAVATAWLSSPNPLQRSRMVMALAHIGPFNFVDANHNGERDPDEKSAGVDLLTPLIHDPDPAVRTAVAFALGEIGDPTSLPALFELAHDPDHADVAAEAVEAISKMAAVAPLDRYEELTREGIREGVRARAVCYLFRFNRDPASDIAARLLGDQDAKIREEAAFALSRRAYAPARSKLELLLNDAGVLTRAYAVRALGLIADAQSFDPLVDSLMDREPWVRTNAARAITQVLTKNPSLRERKQATEDVVRLATVLEDADPGTRAVAIDLVGQYATTTSLAHEKLMHLATEGSRWQRELALAALARAFGAGPDSPVTDQLVDAAGPAAKRAILDATAAIPAGVVFRSRYAIDPDPTVRAAAIGAIPDESVDAEIAVIGNAILDGDVITRANAIDRFSHQKKAVLSDAVEGLRAAWTHAYGDSQDDARLSVLQVLAGIDYPEREAFLRQALTDRDPVIRRTAAELIRDQLHHNLPQYTPLAIDRPISEYARIVEWSHKPHTAAIEMPRGEIRIVLLAQDAPMTAWNFAQLATSHYFDGSSFMRVVPNFVIQGGDPRNDMNGGPGYSIRDEINMQKYTRGAVGMALSGPDTGGSQFFVTHSPQPHLDGGYTIFGRVIGGMASVVDQVERGDLVTSIRIDSFPPETSEK